MWPGKDDMADAEDELVSEEASSGDEGASFGSRLRMAEMGPTHKNLS